VINRFVWASLERHGRVNADPHPGNYLFHEDGTVTFLDFGCVKRFDEEQRRKFNANAEAVLALDAEALRRMENVMVLPHLGSATEETRTAMGMKVVDNVTAFFEGRDAPDRVV
jgi:predicted unusual protein kinase regulating ubiquinone biosynthesis (AarF/ABC1/UbiB family)